MSRWAILSMAVFLFAGISLAQQPPVLPAPGQSDGVLGPQLIAWSVLQKPQPVPQQPQPLPPPDTSATPQSAPKPEAETQTSAQQPEKQAPQPAASTITGTIVKIGSKYVLETSDNLAYQLDDQEKAREYEGKHVKVVGILNRTTGIIHVNSIELLS
jgi:uncharacterized protein DUF5818